MAEKIKRERARWNGQLVTILGVGRGRNPDMEIRDGYGFRRTVKQRELERIPADDPTASYVYEDPAT